ncbi:MAG TPA: hypothetical protein VLG74_02855 [Blastocatellia bacterium]|nr:hypothetical protein [Blastocatellia bacterium]
MSSLQRIDTPEGPVVRMQELSPEYQEIMVLAGVLQRSGYFKDIRDQAQAVTKILFGRDFGISPTISMSAIHVIEGKPALSSNLMAALIKRSGKYTYRVKSWNDTECVLMFREKVDGKWEDIGESSFTMEDAKRAGVVRDGGGWKKYPKAMLFARALSQGERAHCPDVSICPLYVPEELGAQVNESGEVVSAPEAPRKFDVPRTTEAIPIPGPAMVAAADSGTSVKVAEPQTASVAREEVPSGETALPSREPGEDDEPPTAMDPSEPTIDLPRSRALHREFREALTNKKLQLKSEMFLRNWLKSVGYYDKDQNGTTKTIPMVLFEEVKASAIKYAKAIDFAENNKGK